VRFYEANRKYTGGNKECQANDQMGGQIEWPNE
jgi:hypothetical protein